MPLIRNDGFAQVFVCGDIDMPYFGSSALLLIDAPAICQVCGVVIISPTTGKTASICACGGDMRSLTQDELAAAPWAGKGGRNG